MKQKSFKIKIQWAVSNNRKWKNSKYNSKIRTHRNQEQIKLFEFVGPSILYICVQCPICVGMVRFVIYFIVWLCLLLYVYTIYIPSAFSTRINSEIIAAENIPEMRSLLLIWWRQLSVSRTAPLLSS